MKILCAALVALVLFSPAVFSAEQGTATGQMVVNGKAVKLTHAKGITFQDDVTFSAPVSK